MAEEQQTPEETTEATTAEAPSSTPEGPDFSWAPESFVKDGALDTEGFRARFDELTAFEAQENERKASLPTDPAQFDIRVPELNLPDDLSLPKDKDGNDIPLMIDEDDPELPALRQLGIELGIDQSGMEKILHLHAVRELRAAKARADEASQEMAKLGPEAKTRISEIERQLGARLPKEMAKAVTDGITSADALRGLERLMSGNGTRATTSPPSRPDLSSMSPLERLEFASRNGKKSA